jgi:pyruvate dehydrogenase E2 component (dihydrolipoamide acetyltransferase)
MEQKIIADWVTNCPPDCECYAVVSFWYKGENEEVSEGEELVELDSGDSTTVLEAPASGRLSKVLVPEGGRVLRLEAVGVIE